MVEITFNFYSKLLNEYLSGYYGIFPYEGLTIPEIKEIIKYNKMNFYRKSLYKSYNKNSKEYEEKFKISEEDIRIVYRVRLNSLNLIGEIN